MSKKKKHLRNRLILASAAAVILVIIAVFSSALAPNDPYASNALMIRQPPSAAYPFGTDNLGRCVFSRVLAGARTTIAATFFLVAISFVIGMTAGIISGYCGGLIDEIIMRLADLLLAFPQMVVAITAAGILGGGLRVLSFGSSF